MSLNLYPILIDLLTRAGVDTKDDKYLSLQRCEIGVDELLYNDLRDALNKLMTVDEARNSNDLRKHFTHNALDPVDKEIERWFLDTGIVDEYKLPVLGDKNTYNKLRKSLELAYELGGSANNNNKREIEAMKALHDEQLSILLDVIKMMQKK